MLLVVFCILAQILLSRATCETKSTFGTRFILGIPNTVMGMENNTVFLHIIPQSSTTADVQVKIPFIRFSHHFKVNDKLILPLPGSLSQKELGLQTKGIEIESDSIISVVAMTRTSGISDEGFLVLPASALSNRYLVMAYTPYSTYPNSVLIVALENDTSAEIIHATNGQSVVTPTGRMNRFDSYQLLQYIDDLSGAVVTSNKPVAVIASSYHTYVPVGGCRFNLLAEQMIPSKFWTNRYTVAPLLGDVQLNLVRILSDYDITTVHVSNSTHNVKQYLSKGNIWEIMFASEPMVIESDKPISVFQFIVSICNSSYWYTRPSPAMITVQGLSQFKHNYIIYNPSDTTFYYGYPNNFIVLTVQKNTSDGLMLDSKNITQAVFHLESVPLPLDDYIILYVNVSGKNTHHIEHIHGDKFGAFIYGFSYYGGEYVYPLGLTLTDSECQKGPGFPTEAPSTTLSTDSRAVTSPTSYPYTASTGDSSSTGLAFLNGSSVNTSSGLKGNGTWCFDCDNMAHLKYCDFVQRCQENEVCYVMRYPKSNSVEVFKSGCAHRSICESSTQYGECHQCCQDSFCNTRGCGDIGLPVNRGPFCFACDHTGSLDVCQTAQMCAPGQICKVEKYVWGTEFHFKMGCVDHWTCRSRREATKRSTPVCHRCCTTDFCNTDCTAGRDEAFIG